MGGGFGLVALRVVVAFALAFAPLVALRMWVVLGTAVRGAAASGRMALVVVCSADGQMVGGGGLAGARCAASGWLAGIGLQRVRYLSNTGLGMYSRRAPERRVRNGDLTDSRDSTRMVAGGVGACSCCARLVHGRLGFSGHVVKETRVPIMFMCPVLERSVTAPGPKLGDTVRQALCLVPTSKSHFSRVTPLLFSGSV